MQVSIKPKVGISEPLRHKVVTNIADRQTPFFTEGYVARRIDGILKQRRIAATKVAVNAHREVVRQPKRLEKVNKRHVRLARFSRRVLVFDGFTLYQVADLTYRNTRADVDCGVQEVQQSAICQ